MRIHGVTPEMVQAFALHGQGPLKASSSRKSATG
jgi:hypothetical protein